MRRASSGGNRRYVKSLVCVDARARRCRRHRRCRWASDLADAREHEWGQVRPTSAAHAARAPLSAYVRSFGSRRPTPRSNKANLSDVRGGDGGGVWR